MIEEFLLLLKQFTFLLVTNVNGRKSQIPDKWSYKTWQMYNILHSWCNYLVEVEHQVQFTHIVEVFIQDLHKIVYSFQVAQVIVIHIHAYTEVQPCIPSVHDLEVPELK